MALGDPLPAVAKPVAKLEEAVGPGETGQASASVRERAADEHGEPGARVGERPGQVLLALDDQLCRGGRSRRPQVSDEVRDGDVGLVADRGDRRDGGRGQRARDPLVVERSQVLGRAAAARDDQDVESAAAVERANGARNLRRGHVALDPDRVNRDREAVEPASEHVQDVPDRGSGRRRDDADVPREKRDRPLLCLVEEPFRGELRLQLLERELEGADPDRLDREPPDLELAGRRIEIEVAAHDHLEADFRTKFHAQQVGGENDRVQGAGLVLQREVAVSSPLAPASDLSRHRHVPPRRAQNAGHLGQNLRNGVRARRRRRGNGTKRHRAHSTSRRFPARDARRAARGPAAVRSERNRASTPPLGIISDLI